MFRDYEDNYPVEMINDANKHFIDRTKEFIKKLEDVETPLYFGMKIKKLSFLVRFYNLKAKKDWSDIGFS